MTPIRQFNQWFAEELNLSKVSIPSACCLSTTGLDGFPNARFVSLKSVLENAFIVTGPLNSRKGIEIRSNSKVALTFWWTATERQVRIQGVADEISDQLADQYFSERNRDSQIVSIVSDQGREVENMDQLIKAYDNVKNELKDKPIERTAQWGGYAIKPVRIEFLAFSATRFHNRQLFEIENGIWSMKNLQP